MIWKPQNIVYKDARKGLVDLFVLAVFRLWPPSSRRFVLWKRARKKKKGTVYQKTTFGCIGCVFGGELKKREKERAFWEFLFLTTALWNKTTMKRKRLTIHQIKSNIQQAVDTEQPSFVDVFV